MSQLSEMTQQKSKNTTTTKPTASEETWAVFRKTHPDLYSLEFKASKWWPYTEPRGRVK